MKLKLSALFVCALFASCFVGCTEPLGPVDVVDRSDEKVESPVDEKGDVGIEPH